MKRGFFVAVGGAASVIIVGLSGCSSGKPSSETTAAPGEHRVTIDGQDHNIEGTVVCTTMDGNLDISIGDAATGIGVIVSQGDSPTATWVDLGDVNGVPLSYTPDTGGQATAHKDGNTYKISGTATGLDLPNPLQPGAMHNPLHPVNKPFEIDVTCP